MHPILPIGPLFTAWGAQLVTPQPDSSS